MDAPNNCWPATLAKFADALVASATFQSLVELPGGSAADVGKFVFGKRLTHARSGNVWTAEELANLRHYAMVYGDPERPYGKHLQDNACYKPHGVTVIALGRLVPEKDLAEHDANRTGLTDEHDRQWQNIVGLLIEELLTWLAENGGPYPIQSVDVTDDHENRSENADNQGMWQYSEISFQHGVQQ